MDSNLHNKIEELVKIKDMAQSPGWALIKGHFESVKAAVLEQILIEKKPEEFVRLQERYRAFNSPIEAVDVLLEELKLRQEELRAEEQNNADKVF